MKAKRIIVLLLAAAVIFSSFSFAATAKSKELSPTGKAETATITIKTFEGITDVKTVNVGDSFTVYTFLNTKYIDDGKISSALGKQTYTDSVLALTDEVDDEEHEVLEPEEMFPVMGDNAMGHLTSVGTLEFVGSTRKSFSFFDNDSKLIKTNYTVIAGGEAVIETSLTTLARSDKALTKIIKNGSVVSGYSLNMFSLFEDNYKEHLRVTGSTVSLKGDIGVNLYIYIPDFFTGEKAVTFSWGSDEAPHSETVDLKTAKINDANHSASCYVSAKNMTDTIHMSLTDDGEEILSYDTKVATYAVRAANYYPDNTRLKDLLCGMLEYGGAAQRQFEYRAFGDDADLADSYIADIDDTWQPADTPDSLETVTNMSGDALDDYGIAYAGGSILTTSATTVRVFFTVKESSAFEKTAVKLGDKTLEFKDGQSGMKYIEISNISAKNIFDTYTLTFSNPDADTNSYLYSAANYYNGVMSGSYSAEHKACVKALYNYYLYAKEYLS